jgi:hypothetical protein
VVDGVEDELHAGRNAQFVEDAEHVFLDGVLAEIQFAGNVAVAEALGDESDDLFFARGQEWVSTGVEHAKRWDFGDQVEQKSHLLGVGPNLASGDALDTAAEQAEMGIGNAEDAARTGAERADHEVAVVGFHQENFGDQRMGKMNPAHRRHLTGNINRVIQRENDYFCGGGSDRLQDRSDIDQAGGDAEFRTPAEGADEEMGLHTVGVRNEDGDCGGSGGRGRTHENGAPDESG